MAILDKPIFDEPIEAWAHGPVVPVLYHSFKVHGSNPIPRPECIDFSIYSDETREVLDEVHKVYGQFSAWKLRNMTHEEPPWVEASETRSVISQESLKEYFKTQLTCD